jgi:parallel beta-helix repeat protein
LFTGFRDFAIASAGLAWPHVEYLPEEGEMNGTLALERLGRMLHKLVFSWRGALLGVLAGAVSLAALAALPFDAGAASTAPCGGTISAPGTYVLMSNCDAGAAGVGHAITITSSDVTLKLNGQTIKAGVGVVIDDSSAAISGVAIKGPGTIQAGAVGVEFGPAIVGGHGISGSSVSGLTITGYTNAGIALSVPDTGNTITGNTTTAGSLSIDSGGIGVSGSDNTITSNTANNNSFDGIAVGGSDNTISGNTTNGTKHSSGIILVAGLAGGIVTVIPTGNTINHNTANNNHVDGIALLSNATGSPTGNTINSNTADNNLANGIVLAKGATGNTINNNTAETNALVDLFDGNSGCDSNTWRNNTFGTSNPAQPSCIH